MSSNAPELYKRIQQDPRLTQALFKQALQDPKGAIESICAYGAANGLPVSSSEVKAYLADMDDDDTKQWVIKARGGM
tara:strand:- start:23 stop:253 length:231 start_codon:yes stop_codon:yes gene_type:complete